MNQEKKTTLVPDIGEAMVIACKQGFVPSGSQ
jgi:hypothetical protein